MESSIPLIDLSKFKWGSAEERLSVTKQMLEACRDVGFVYLLNHAVPQDLVDEAFSWSAKFFALPLSEKEKAPHPPEGWWHRGYSGIGREKVVQMTTDRSVIDDLRNIPDYKESFEIGREDNTSLPNVWPPVGVLPGFQEFWAKFYDACYEAELNILKLLETVMGLEEDFLVGFHSQKDNQIRLLHYPEVEEKVLLLGQKERIAAHTDFGTMTMLFQDDIGGLEVEDPANRNRFIAVPPIPGTIVLNLGDFMQRWSNDTLKSTMHRVRAPSAGIQEAQHGMVKARYSIPYFVGADTKKVIECLPGTYGPDRPRKYEPITASEYIDERLNATY